MPCQSNVTEVMGSTRNTQVIHAVFSMLRESFIKMNAWGIEEQVGQAPTCAPTRTPTPTTIHANVIALAIVIAIGAVFGYCASSYSAAFSVVGLLCLGLCLCCV